MLKNWWGTTGGNTTYAPAGLIVLFNGPAANIHAGWSQLNSGIFVEDRFIKGSNLNPVSGGSNITESLISTTAGAHKGSNNLWKLVDTTDYTNVNYAEINSYAIGGHAHSATLTYTPAEARRLFIKADQDFNLLPSNAAMLSDEDIGGGFSDITPTELTLGLQTGAANEEIAGSIGGNTSASNGAHDHLVNPPGGSSGTTKDSYYWWTAGLHTHEFSVSTVTDDILRCWVSVWSSASELRISSGLIGMWEDINNIPDRWSVCDGTNGTPNMVNRFIGLDSAKRGTESGNGTLTASGSLASAGLHNHRGTIVNAASDYGPHDNDNTHTHSVGEQTVSHSPLNYTLIFIKYTG